MTPQIICGIHAVWGRLKKHPSSIYEIHFVNSRHDKRIAELQAFSAKQNIRMVLQDGAALDRLCAGVRHQGVAAKVEALILPQHIDDVLDDLTEPALLLILDGVQDPHNLGACLRTAEACGAHAVVAPKDRAAGLTSAVRKVACGAAEAIPFITVTNLARTLREIKERDIWVLGTADDASVSLYSVKLDRAIAWVMGAEGEGMRRLTRETCDELVAIPMLGTVTSLNVSVASGVCLFEAQRQRHSHA